MRCETAGSLLLLVKKASDLSDRAVTGGEDRSVF